MFYALRSVSAFIKRHSKRYFIGTAASLIENVMVVLPTYLIGLLIDAWVQGSLTAELIRRYFLLTLLSLVVGYATELIWTYNFFGASDLYQHDIRRLLVRLFLRRRAVFYEKFSSGDLMARTTQDSMYVGDLLGWGADIVISSGTYTLVLLGMMLFQADLRLILAALIPYVIYFFLISKHSVKVEKHWQDQQEAFTKLNDSVLEGVEGIRNIRAYAKDKLFRARFEAKTGELAAMNNRLALLVSAYNPASYIASILSTLITLGLGSYFVSRGSMTMGALISFQVYMTSLVNPIGQFGELFNLMQNANASARRLDELFQSGDGMESGDVKLEHFENMELRKYRFRYPSSQKDNLSEIDLHVNAGKTLGIAGRTGSGKTTLIRQLQRQYPAGSGSFEINGIPLAEIRPDGLNQAAAFVEQDTMLFSGSIRENLLFAAPDAGEEELLDALETAGFSLESERMKEGLDTVIGEQGITLSGGQKQRLTIARALLADTDLLVIDDALSAVDAETEARILRQLAELRRDKANIVSAHRLSCLEHADEIIVLDQGKIIDRGTHPELLARDGWYRKTALLQNVRAGALKENTHEITD